MSLDRTPSPQPSGGWASPGLTTTSNPYESNHHRIPFPSSNSFDGPSGSSNGSNSAAAAAGKPISWANAKASSARVNGFASYSKPRSHQKNEGFFGRHMRQISQSLPVFMHGGGPEGERYELKEKPLRSRFSFRNFSWRNIRSMSWQDWRAEVQGLPARVPKSYVSTFKRNRGILGFLFVLLSLLLWFQSELTYAYRRTSWLGGGSKFVIILAANEEGGVMYWKGAREWAIERDSMKNKRRYTERWGYELEIVDMSTKKKYAHEWRESWEKADFIRNAMKKYPDAEWFWWLDLNTFIMEPSVSLQQQLFNNLKDRTYRDINLYNPLNINHPPNGTSGDPDAPKYANYLDPISLSVNGDNDPDSINLLISQDCSGFNLGSFFVKRSPWSDRLLDMWWDPVFYEQRHMEWEHKEQDALEYLYTNQPWVRPHVGFVPQRLINAFPNGACGDDRGLPHGGCKGGVWDQGEDLFDHECGIQGVHYQQSERDFFVNFAGCEWGRDCWGEMYNFRQLSNRLNRGWGEQIADWCRESWRDFWHPPPPKPKEEERHDDQQQQDDHHDDDHHDDEHHDDDDHHDDDQRFDDQDQQQQQDDQQQQQQGQNNFDTDEKAAKDALAADLAVDGVARDGFIPDARAGGEQDSHGRNPVVQEGGDARLADLLDTDPAHAAGMQRPGGFDDAEAAAGGAGAGAGAGAAVGQDGKAKEAKKPIIQ